MSIRLIPFRSTEEEIQINEVWGPSKRWNRLSGLWDSLEWICSVLPTDSFLQVESSCDLLFHFFYVLKPVRSKTIQKVWFSLNFFLSSPLLSSLSLSSHPLPLAGFAILEVLECQKVFWYNWKGVQIVEKYESQINVCMIRGLYMGKYEIWWFNEMPCYVKWFIAFYWIKWKICNC